MKSANLIASINPSKAAIIAQRFLVIGMAQGRAQLLDIGGKSRFTIPIRSAVHSRSPTPGKTATNYDIVRLIAT
jgi:hypothetical protein